MNEPEKPKKGWGWLQWGFIMVVSLIGVGVAIPTFHGTAVQSRQTSASNNCRQIIMALRLYAEEHKGAFPDEVVPGITTANGAFRELIREQIIEDERIFSAIASPFIADGNIGQHPSYLEAVSAGENHWMMIAKLRSSDPGHYPFLMENARSNMWPPTWLSDQREKPLRGRAWLRGSIIIGRIDNSVNIVRLDKREGSLHLPESFLKPVGKPPLPDFQILDIEEKK